MLNSKISVEIRRHQPFSPWTYESLDYRQREIAAGVRKGARGKLLVSEVAPVITLGRRTQPGDLLFNRELLMRQGIQVCSTDRGGLATYHGPGQWILFAVDHLEVLTGDARGVRKAVSGLLEVALEVGRTYHSQAEIRSGAALGVWTPQGKFAAVGVHVEQGVLLHGLAVNGFRTPTSFVGLRPCGLDAPVAFLLENEQGFEELRDRLIQKVGTTFW